MSPNKLAPIVLFVYNRPEHIRRTVEALAENVLADKSSLYIFSDGAKNETDSKKVNSVREYIKTITGFAEIEIIFRENNLGLANSVISGVSEVFKSHNKVIVLEDDIITSPYFLKYMNELLSYFEKYSRIYSVTGYTFPINIPKDYKPSVYLSPRPSSWGWGTWKDRWEKVDWNVSDYKEFIKDKSKVKEFNTGGDDLTRMLVNSVSGKIDSWAVIWSYTHFKNNAYCVYPVKSRIQNIGADLSGVHTSRTNKFDVEMEMNDVELIDLKNLQPNEELLLNFKKFFKKNIFSAALARIRK